MVRKHGYVDLVDGLLSETGQEARQALVFVLVAIKRQFWLRSVYKKVMAKYIVVASITFDSAPSNKSMKSILEYDLHLNNRNPTIN